MSPGGARHVAKRDAASETEIALAAGTIGDPVRCIRQSAPNVARTPRYPSVLEVTAPSIVTTASDSVAGRLPREDSKGTSNLHDWWNEFATFLNYSARSCSGISVRSEWKARVSLSQLEV